MERIGSRVYPQRKPRKRSALAVPAVLAVVALLGGCGGGTKKQEAAGRLVVGHGFSYEAPSDWTVTVTVRAAVAKRDEVTLVSVTVLPLVRAYRAALFPRVVRELDGVAATLAGRLRGAITARRTVIVGGRVRQYEIAHGELVDRLTFVLRGKREFQLTCRWHKLDGKPAACGRLEASFRIR